MNILSLFDGMSCGQLALNRANIKIDNYFASEIKPFAMNYVNNCFPNTIQVGDVTKINYKFGKVQDKNGNEVEDYYLETTNGDIHCGKIDMLIGGSPCQDFSSAKAFNKVKNYGLEGDQSSLFYNYLGILHQIQEYHPVYFFLENVHMKVASEKELNEYLGVSGIHINSILISIQNRPRIYWTNIPNVELPEDKGINFQDYRMRTLYKFENVLRTQKYEKDFSNIEMTNEEIEEICSLNKNMRNLFKESGYEYSNEEFANLIHNQLRESVVSKTPSRDKMWDNGEHIHKFSCYNVTNEKKVHCLTRKQDRCPNSGLIAFGDYCRFLTRGEMELAQTVPLNWTKDMSYANLQDVLGDGWTVDTIAHVFSFLPNEYKNN